MNHHGLTDSPATLQAATAECPHCHLSSCVTHGLCLGCLLEAGTGPEETLEPEEFDAALAAVPVADTHWRLGNYEILEEIGRGGMGVIYRARQRHSRRIVALKRVLSYHADSRDTLVRFRREAEAAASLDHPHILPIFEVGESEDGVPYFSMKYAAGGSLQEVGPTLRDDPRQVVRLLAKVTRAVQHAHRQGILHRDLKPGNILLDGRGEPLVSDFGLAKWLDASSDLTRTLTVFGTPGYIAPEQAEGPAANLKPTADVYSLGAILFDLLAGRPPFLGEHALAVIRQAADNPAPKLRSLVRGADKDLETICARCLERDPAARYRTAGDLAEDLERWLEGRSIVARPVLLPVQLWRWAKCNRAVAASIAATMAVLAIALGRQIHTARLAEEVRENEAAFHSIAVLPFLDLDTVEGNKQLADSFAHALSLALAGLGPSRVVVMTDGIAAVPGAGTLADLRQIERQTGVRTVLRGTLRQVENKRRVALRLVHVKTGDTLFARTVDLATAHPAQEATALFVKELFTALSASQPATGPVDPALSDPAAHEFLRAGDELFGRRSVSELRDALSCYRRAIQLQPKSAVARASFVITAMQLTVGRGDAALLKEAEAYALEAVALNPALDFSHRALGAIYFSQGKTKEAREQCFQTIETGGLRYGLYGLWTADKLLGRPDMALRWAAISNHWNTRPADGEFLIGDCWSDLADDQRAEFYYRRVSDLHPEIPEGWMGLCRLKLLQRDFDSARAIYRANLARHRDYGFAQQMAAQVEFFSGNFAEAERLYVDLAEQDPSGGGSFYGALSYDSALGRLKQIAGNQSGETILKRCLATEKATLALAPDHPEVLYRVAAIESSLGDIESSLVHLRASAAAGWLDYRSLALDPRFDALRQDARFQQLLNMMRHSVERLARSM